VIRVGWPADDLQPFLSSENLGLIPLSLDAAAAAARLGAAIATMPAERAVYVVGTVYTTALPEAYRAAHGIFYTPPQLVERLLLMSEEAGPIGAPAGCSIRPVAAALFCCQSHGG
jgi:hypothetical protein